MSWFWGRKNDDEYDSDEYDSEEYSDDEEFYSSEEEEGEEEEEDNPSPTIAEGSDQDENQDKSSSEAVKEEMKEESIEESDESEVELESEEKDSYYEEESSEEEEYDDDDDEEENAKKQTFIPVETVSEESSYESQSEYSETELSSNDSDLEEDSDEEEDEVTSFSDKQGLLLLAAEHDRVDILKAILVDENNNDKEETTALMSSGIPPLHVAISFGSTNTTQSLLRMGADPSIRPNVAEFESEIKKDKKKGKLEIKNMARFDGVSAWELAFGNAQYEKFANRDDDNGKWSLFGKSTTSDAQEDADDGEEIRMIRPLNIAPSKREGIRHAFTAEALRCIGGDEKGRLEQLLDSGMPPTIDIGGKDLYGWAVEMGALQCEEILRPAEAAKYDGEKDTDETVEPKPEESSQPRAKVLDRSGPGNNESIPQLENRLTELESLASMLSTCLDNLAEEVSVCHGLLLMSGGASALASHVKSIKTQISQKEDELHQAQNDWQAYERHLEMLIQQTGEVGKEVDEINPNGTKFRAQLNNENGKLTTQDEESQRRQLLKAQIAASEHQTRKLRTSIADLSEESSRCLKEVEQRGLSGGIDLVRTLRDELRDVDFKLSETKTMIATCRTKISMINARMKLQEENMKPQEAEQDEAPVAATPPAKQTSQANWEESTTSSIIEDDLESIVMSPPPSFVAQNVVVEKPGKIVKIPKEGKSASEKIATGDSQALAVRAPGNQGYFKVDLWQVILRIIGLHRAADRRAIEVLAKQEKQGKGSRVMLV